MNCSPTASPRPKPTSPHSHFTRPDRAIRSNPPGAQHGASSYSSQRSSRAPAAEAATAASRSLPHQFHHHHHQTQRHPAPSSTSPRHHHHRHHRHGPARRPTYAGGAAAAGGRAAAWSGPCGAPSCRALRAAWCWCSTAGTGCCRRRGNRRRRPRCCSRWPGGRSSPRMQVRQGARGMMRMRSRGRRLGGLGGGGRAYVIRGGGGNRRRRRRRRRRLLLLRNVRRAGGAAGAVGYRSPGGPRARGFLPSPTSSGSDEA